MRKLTEEECIAISGHCYEVSNQVVMTLPPIYHRICKHCGKRQESRVHDSFEWRDD